ncbi:MAG: GNAT family N-acetyltransferase [Saccharofermentans sp.]|nr:GNAT family N-acetyltransferase [Saccharofermentans sp.]
MEITSERLLIRPLGPEYLETYNAYAMNTENARYMCFLPHEDEKESLEFLKKAEAEWSKPDPVFYEFAIIHNGEHIGGISVHKQWYYFPA